LSTTIDALAYRAALDRVIADVVVRNHATSARPSPAVVT
jgi:hypothetical protein